MPHQCTNCGRTFADGSKEMLSGCPSCGGNKFQFRPSASTDATGGTDASSGSTGPGERGEASAGDADSGASPSAGGRPDTGVESDDPPSSVGVGSDAHPSTSDVGPDAPTDDSDLSDEDRAQIDARRDVVSRNELESATQSPNRKTPDQEPPNQEPPDQEPPAEREGADEPSSEERPGLDELREELNEQFESIRIVSPGQYELNLMELYDRDEYIISLQEDGRYVIDVPDTWQDEP